MKQLFISLSVLSFLVMNSCATMNKAQCVKANWKDLGVQEGSMGYANTRLSDHTKACAEYGIKPDEKAYDKGYKAGIRIYCSPQKAFEIGRTGGHSSVTCPSDLAPGFYTAMDQGRAQYRRELAAKEAEQKAREQEARAREYFSADARGGLCDASESAGICYVFTGVKYTDPYQQRPNRRFCNLIQGIYSPSGQCPLQEQLGRCTVSRGRPEEQVLYYYYRENINLALAQRDCVDPRSSAHSQGAGEWTPVP
jgi:hypothetical protein